MDVIISALYGVLIGFEDFTSMSYYLKKHEEELTEKLELAAGVPPHDAFSNVFRAIDVEAFMCGCGISIGQKEASEKQLSSDPSGRNGEEK